MLSSCPAGHLRHRACCILWLVDSVVEEDPALVDSVVDPQLLSQAPGRSEGDQKLRQSRKRNHGSSLFLLCLNFGPCAVWLGPCGTSWGSTPGGVLYVPVALSLGLWFFRMKVLQKPNPQNHKNCQKNIQNCAKIMQNRRPRGHFGVILVSFWCPWAYFGNLGRPRGPPKGAEAKKRRKREFADPPPGTPFGDPWATLGAIGPTFSSFLVVG